MTTWPLWRHRTLAFQNTLSTLLEEMCCCLFRDGTQRAGLNRTYMDADRRYDGTSSLRDAETCLALGSGALLLLVGASRRSMAGALLAMSSAPLLYRGITGHWPALPNGLTPSDNTKAALAGTRGVHVRESIRLEVPLADVYGFWRRLENLPRFMTHLDRVIETSDGKSHWVAVGPAGLAVEWDAEIINEVDNKLIAWRSLPGSDVVTAGSVNFDAARAGRSTQVSVAPAIRATSGQGRRPDRVALRPRAFSNHPRGSPALQAAARSR